MKCIDELRKHVEALGGSIDMQGFHSGFINMDSPRHKVWSSTGDTSIVLWGSNGSQSWWQQVCKDAMSDIKLGVEAADKDIEIAWWINTDGEI